MILGHQKVWEYLAFSQSNDLMAHAYLFYGPDHVGKKKIALEYAKLINCTQRTEKTKFACGKCKSCLDIDNLKHPDIMIIGENTGKDDEESSTDEIKIGQIRQIQQFLSLTPHSSKIKIAIIDGVNKLNKSAANCLLKTLEEPPIRSLFILIATDPKNVISTIASRCQIIRFSLVPASQASSYLKKLKNSNIEKIQKISAGRPGVAISYLSDNKLAKRDEEALLLIKNILSGDLNLRFKIAETLAKDIEKSKYFLSVWLLWFRDIILSANGLSDITLFEENKSMKVNMKKMYQLIRQLQNTQYALSYNGANCRLCLEDLFINI